MGWGEMGGGRGQNEKGWGEVTFGVKNKDLLLVALCIINNSVCLSVCLEIKKRADI